MFGVPRDLSVTEPFGECEPRARHSDTCDRARWRPRSAAALRLMDGRTDRRARHDSKAMKRANARASSTTVIARNCRRVLFAFLARASNVDAAAYAERVCADGSRESRARRTVRRRHGAAHAERARRSARRTASTGEPGVQSQLDAARLSVRQCYPGLRGARGAPSGVQVIGRPLDDARCLAAAGFVEQAIIASAWNNS